jgi:glycosyltransferase involved in cell wall biosynthesis
MKILHCVESYYPALGGMQEVVKQLSERLVLLGHDVTVAASKHTERNQNAVINGVEIISFSVSGSLVRGMQGQVDEYRNFLLNSDYDVIVNFAAQQWATDIALPILSQIKGRKVFVPTGFSGYFLPEYKNYFENMKSWMKNYDMNIFLSDNYRDINFARENGIDKTMLIPNGAAEDEFLKQSGIDIREKLGISSNTLLILHVGSYTGIKGQAEACQIFYRANIDNAVLLLIGNNNEIFLERYWYKVSLPLLFFKKYKKGKRIIATHTLNRQETVAAYKAADVFLFPSNIECSPIVLFECMASETPYLTTDVGNSKEIISWSQSGILLPTTIDAKGYSHADISSSAKILEELVSNKKERVRLSTNGYQAWKNNFTWEIIAQKYETLYHNLISKK